MRDSYLRFFSEGYISKEQFFEFGLKETIYASADKAEQEWGLLKKRIYGNEKVYIRGFGRDSNGTHLFQRLYKHLVGNESVTKDSTNNAEPTKIIHELTGYSKIKTLGMSQYAITRLPTYLAAQRTFLRLLLSGILSTCLKCSTPLQVVRLRAS